MSLRVKNILYSILLIGAVYVVWVIRQSAETPVPVSFHGETMGTTYSIKYFDAQQRDLKTSVDSLLGVFNECLST